MSVPSQQWAQVIEKKGSCTYKQIPVAKPGPDEVLVNIKYSGVCHTDLHAMNGDWPLATKPYPLVGGHEGAGVVAAKGELVSDDDIKIGDHVGVKVSYFALHPHHFQMIDNANSGSTELALHATSVSNPMSLFAPMPP